MREVGARSSACRFLDLLRHIIVLPGTLIVLCSLWRSSPGLAAIAALPVYIVLLNVVGFLILPLYYFTPERKTASELRRCLEKGDRKALRRLARRVRAE